MKVKEGFVLRQVADENIVVAVDAAVLNFNGMINLNDTGAFLWKCLENESTEEQLLKSLLSKYDVTKMEAENDLQLFLKKIDQAGFLEK